MRHCTPYAGTLSRPLFPLPSLRLTAVDCILVVDCTGLPYARDVQVHDP